MPGKARLTRQDFNRIPQKGGRRIHGDLFSLSTSALPAHSGAKVAVVVSKKVAPYAVARNLLRRRCREVVRPLLGSLGKPLSLVFYAKRDAGAASFAAVKRDIEHLMAQMR